MDSIRASIDVPADVGDALASWSELAASGHASQVDFEPLGRRASRVTVRLACRPTRSARRALARRLVAFESVVGRRSAARPEGRCGHG